MKIEITIGGVIRKYGGSYDELYNNDWNEIVRDMLDVSDEYEKEREANEDYAFKHPEAIR